MSELHICWTECAGYLPRVRRPGHRNYEVLGKKRRTLSAAMHALAMAMATGKYKRGDVLHCTPITSYYEPHVMYEMVQI